MSYDKTKPITILLGSNSFIRVVLGAMAGAIVGACTFAEETVQLANNEVENISQMQKIRLDAVAAERADLAAERDTANAHLAAMADGQDPTT